MAQPLVTELASTENTSSSGARVQTARSWRPNAPVILKSAEGELWAHGRVVYCQRLQLHGFAVGLDLMLRTGAWVGR